MGPPLSGLFSSKDAVSKKYVDKQFDNAMQYTADTVEKMASKEYVDEGVENAIQYTNDAVSDVFDKISKNEEDTREELLSLIEHRNAHNKKLGDLTKTSKDINNRTEILEQEVSVLWKDHKVNDDVINDILERLSFVEEYQMKDVYWHKRAQEIDKENKEHQRAQEEFQRNRKELQSHTHSHHASHSHTHDTTIISPRRNFTPDENPPGPP